MDLLELKSISKIYQQGKIEVPALREINLNFESGEFSTVFGPSGSGKTTLLNIIGCLDKPTSGNVFFEGEKIDEYSKKELALVRRYNIGFVFQSFNLIPVFTAYENVEFAMRLLDVGPEEIKERVYDILEAVGLKGMESRHPNELSGGQKQRVAIARALVKEPKLVLADEPTANLDSETGENILEIMLEMNQKLKTTFIFSTHDPQVMDYARRLIEIKDGQVSKEERREKVSVSN